MHLVDHQQPHVPQKVGQHVGSELRVVEAFRGDEKQVDRARPNGLEDGIPSLPIGAVDGLTVQTEAIGHWYLIAHQGDERGNDHRGPAPSVAEQTSGYEVDGALPPTRTLDQQQPAPLLHNRPNGLPLGRSELGLGAHCLTQQAESLLEEVACHDRHDLTLQSG